VPMFTLGEVRDWRWANTGLWLAQIGLLGFAPALAWQLAPFALLSALAITAGIICSAVGISCALVTRQKRVLDPGTRSFVRGGIGVCAAAIAGLLLIAPGSPGGSTPGGYGAMPYAVLAVGGGLLPCIAGMMCKIVPFLTWMRAYGPQVGRGPTPSAGALTMPRLETWAFALQGIAVLPLMAGAWSLNLPLLRVGAWLLAAGVGLFLTDMLSVLKHLWWPSTGDAGATAKTRPSS